MRERDIVEGLIEITLPDSENFLKIKETLTRIGIASVERDENGHDILNGWKKLYQSCHILHKKGKYYIVHFKELFLLDGYDVFIDEEDYERRDKIAFLLQDWNLIDIVEPRALISDSTINLKVVPFRDKRNWKLIPKYNIGKK